MPDEPRIHPLSDLRTLGAAYLTEAEVAVVCRTSPGTLRNWRSEGKGPPVTTAAHKPLYRACDVADWLDAGLRNGPVSMS